MSRPVKKLKLSASRSSPAKVAEDETTNDDHDIVEAGKDSDEHLPSPSLPAATDDEKKQWQGFAELENDPAFFTTMIRDFGVKGIKTQEVVDLDNFLTMDAKSIHGLIFLFRYREEDDIDEDVKCAEGLWFANQTQPLSCGTMALLNVLLNVEGAELGPNLEAFKEFTKDLTPSLRGDAVGSFEFAKAIHNSFTRKMDMLSVDLYLRGEHARGMKRKGAAKKRKRQAVESDDDGAFHFNAFVPVDGKVWKLDGVEQRPTMIGEFEDAVGWVPTVSPFIEAKMATYAADAIEFGLIAVVKDAGDDMAREQEESRKALQRRHDYGPAINVWLKMLAEKEGLLEELIADVEESKAEKA